MDRKRIVAMPFITSSGDELQVEGYLVESPYNNYFEFHEAFFKDDPSEFVDEDDFTDGDLERLPEEAEDFLEEGTLFRD